MFLQKDSGQFDIKMNDIEVISKHITVLITGWSVKKNEKNEKRIHDILQKLREVSDQI